MSSVHNQLLFSPRDWDSVLAHVHLAELKLLRKVIQSGGADLVPGDGVAGVGRLTAHNAAERRDATLSGLHMSLTLTDVVNPIHMLKHVRIGLLVLVLSASKSNCQRTLPPRSRMAKSAELQ